VVTRRHDCSRGLFGESFAWGLHCWYFFEAAWGQRMVIGVLISYEFTDGSRLEHARLCPTIVFPTSAAGLFSAGQVYTLVKDGCTTQEERTDNGS